ncbi:unnamed protein product [Bursaphelenchus okinawaensis]|uniref:Uncharacterized protein n=1 Tax=Bursaphelenchus okinawaensis TaxID=465554 RepID=A0A811KDB2_9BILA|nr:unnamed protein product [Bursaphelenchus okinawaensis]CAG9097944.1 unnamed protein product [Bursaphelenchus okinawaensis]
MAHDKKTDVPNKAKKSKDRKGKLRKTKTEEQDEEVQNTAVSHPPPMKTGESRSPPRQKDEENQRTVFEKVGCPMRPFISPLKKEKKKLTKGEKAMKTAAEEEHSSGASLASENSDAKAATESNESY